MPRLRPIWIVLALVGVSAPASAHFTLVQPGNWAEQDGLGGPEKDPPCGDRDAPGASTAVPTNTVSEYKVGDTVTITIDENIFHPGHYRVALAPDMASLPADPPVTPAGTPCGTTVIDPNPALPLLGDGLLVHTSPFTVPQTAQVQLPSGMLCDHCVLQVEEFMSNHPLNNPGGCFYHHCAYIKITANGADAGVPPDASVLMVSGGGCDAGAGGAGGAALLVLGAGLLVARRRA